MKQELIRRLINIGLRGLSMASRFVLIFAAAKLLSPHEVGLFGLMMATVSLSVLIVGADYYTYAQRELLARPDTERSFVIQHQIIAQLILYAILLPAQIIFFISGWMDWQYAVWFFVLLVLEHVAQELNRLLIAMHKQFIASWVLFVRMGSWVIFIIPLMYFYPSLQNLDALYASWLVGVLIAIVFGLIAVSKSLPVWQRHPIDKQWIKKGFKVGGVFLFATFCFKGILTFDRYAVEHLSDLETLGVYVLYIGVVMGLYNFLDPAVFSFLYPRMLQYYQAGEVQKYAKTFKELLWSTVLISILLAGFILFSMPYILSWLDKAVYTETLSALNILVLAGFLYAVSMIPHYALYAMKKDKWIVVSHISAFGLFLVALVSVSFEQAIEVVGFALCIAFGWMLILKTMVLVLDKPGLKLKV